MKKTAPNSPPSPDLSNVEPSDASKCSTIADVLLNARRHSPTRTHPATHVFTVIANIDTESLLCHACETLASLNVMATDLACEMEGSRRNVVLAIQQLSVLGELLVNRALDNLAPPGGLTEAPSNSQC
jgi:hypothetical protein